MRTLTVNPGTRQVQVTETPPPRLTGEHQVRILVLEVGICGTDREICSFRYGEPPAGDEYLIPGHESLGEVVEVGPAVTACRPGDLVVSLVRRPCSSPACPACRAGWQDFCVTGDFVERGIQGRHGFLAEEVVDEEEYLTVVPPELREVGVLVEPLSIAEKALAQVRLVERRLPWLAEADGPAAGRAALVLGAGPIGLLGAMVFARAGYAVWVYSRESSQSLNAAIARSIGARYVSSTELDIARLAARIDGIHLVYEATGASPFAFQVMKVLGPCGTYVLTGVPGRQGPVELDASRLMKSLVLKNQLVLGTVTAGLDAYEAAASDLRTFLVRWPEAVRRLITGRYPLDAYRHLLGDGITGIKQVITPGS